MAPHREPCRGGTTTPPPADMDTLAEDELVVGEQYWMQDEKGDEVWTLAEVMEQCDGHVSIKLLDSGERKDIDQVRDATENFCWKLSELQQQLDAIRVHTVCLVSGPPAGQLSLSLPASGGAPRPGFDMPPLCVVCVFSVSFVPVPPPAFFLLFSPLIYTKGEKVSCVCLCVLRRLSFPLGSSPAPTA